jgi:hypothetical protein
MELATLLGRPAPYSVPDLFYVYLTRYLPIFPLLLLAEWWLRRERLTPVGGYPADAGSPLELVLSGVVIAPLLETVFFIILILITPAGWYRLGGGTWSPFRRQVILSIVGGALFGLLHLSTSIVVAISAAAGGALMFAVLLQHWLANLRDRGIVMCWAIHVVHNALMLLLAALASLPGLV